MLREINFLNKFLNFKGLIFNYHLKKFYAKEKKMNMIYVIFLWFWGHRRASMSLFTTAKHLIVVHWYTFMDSCGTVCEENCHWDCILERGGPGSTINTRNRYIVFRKYQQKNRENEWKKEEERVRITSLWLSCMNSQLFVRQCQ